MAEDSQWKQYANRFLTSTVPIPAGNRQPDIMVCIPVYAEPDLIRTLESILANDPVDKHIEVLLLFNTDQRVQPHELKTHSVSREQCNRWIKSHLSDHIRFIAVSVDVPPASKGGVGWARKTAMDTAARRLGDQGIILSLDADCLVATNWLQSVAGHFASHPLSEAASLYFQHDLSVLSVEGQSAIGQYELHLRYLRQALRWTGHPFAFHTIGSAMAVRRHAYLRHGGMNTRQAGEDFYFLQKFIEIGTLTEINNTMVIPSSRTSARVPFGTGRAMLQFEKGLDTWMTTHPESFAVIRPLFQQMLAIRREIQEGYTDGVEDILREKMDLPQPAYTFLKEEGFDRHCRAITHQTASADAFLKRFFRYFNSFRMIKYTHYMRDHGYPDVPVMTATIWLCKQMGVPLNADETISSMLDKFRRLDRGEDQL